MQISHHTSLPADSSEIKVKLLNMAYTASLRLPPTPITHQPHLLCTIPLLPTTLTATFLWKPGKKGCSSLPGLPFTNCPLFKTPHLADSGLKGIRNTYSRSDNRTHKSALISPSRYPEQKENSHSKMQIHAIFVPL